MGLVILFGSWFQRFVQPKKYLSSINSIVVLSESFVGFICNYLCNIMANKVIRRSIKNNADREEFYPQHPSTRLRWDPQDRDSWAGHSLCKKRLAGACERRVCREEIHQIDAVPMRYTVQPSRYHTLPSERKRLSLVLPSIVERELKYAVEDGFGEMKVVLPRRVWRETQYLGARYSEKGSRTRLPRESRQRIDEEKEVNDQ